MHQLIESVFLGLALSSIWFWFICLFKSNRTKDEFAFWLKYIVPQGIIIIIAFRIFKNL